ncbi:hypothetical protein IC582_001417 [Cucumis melo]|uniref:Uncharacterized protein LOC103490264 n=1 Tax=Cucumis melo TaxID=3656 RepID=A0A1S4DWY4_CUCME|nr:uncharacterized protein LOC103490264 [Cucumis melo]XP_050946206.1 uncharacterized protein LOC103490264 [Cucumis melo]
MDVDHYAILGLPSGEQGAKLTEKEISKAYRAKALELHPDKRPDDPNAHANFQTLKSSYEILKDEKARKLFDDLLRVKREQHRRQSERDSKRQKMMTDLEARERSAFAPDPAAKELEEEEKIARKLKEEIARIRAMHAKKGAPTTFPPKKETGGVGKKSDGDAGPTMDKERMLKVSWEKIGEDYTAEKLREMFSKFGEVEDVVIRHNKKKSSAVIVMSSKDAAVASTRAVLGDLSNPLLVLPLQPVSSVEMPSAERSPEHNRLDNLVGAGYQAFEDSILKKLQKAGEKQKQ